ncbi:hypothetical protein HNQ35_000500 [Cerasibacillus quisquiliarum]|uniref:Uncharacterized protein n=1 Tax=Cerasibacillus quisquiliarum TaxID=227865 RepID=A0A511UT70_9BACI|nr:hypothetical protein [Cerasibacillus quisquiliarum]MBB5145311.1 hypothetical protein [Cerasibacillus quisquiliarum]GEN29797.1 hypothetical protein CQU01_00350 [Cerasibacillus quisquiliarum]
MKLINVRKGQFVYYQNKLHKVYSVKPFYRQSVHLIRLEDLEQQLATAKEIDLYKPKHLDSFVCNHTRYTLNKDVRAKVGDYILVIKPRPDSLDRHYLHAIEMVSIIEEEGIISHKSNGIKHHEYWVMEPGLAENATIIDKQVPDSDDAHQERTKDTFMPESRTPKIGDIYQKNDSDPVIEAMVIAMEGNTVYLGGDLEVTIDELIDSNNWTYMHQAHH